MMNAQNALEAPTAEPKLRFTYSDDDFAVLVPPAQSTLKHLVGQHDQHTHGIRGRNPHQIGSGLTKWADSLQDRLDVNVEVWARQSIEVRRLSGEMMSVVGKFDPENNSISFVKQPGKENLDKIGWHKVTSLAAMGSKAIISHEFMHAFDKSRENSGSGRVSDTPELKRMFDDCRDQHEAGRVSRVVSKYALINPREFLAENGCAYLTNPKWLKDNYSEMYNFLEGVIDKKVIKSIKEIDTSTTIEDDNLVEVATADGYYWVERVSVTEKELRKLKHLVGQHDQHTHGNRGESFSRNGVEGTVVGMVRETSSMTNPDGTRVRIAKLEDVVKIDNLTPDVLNQEGLIATCIRGKNKGLSFYCANSNTSHSAMINEYDQTDSVDNYVRFWVKNKRVNAGVVSAGKFINDPEDRFIGMRNIDKAAAQLVKLGLPDKTPLHILDTTNYSQNMTADITLKELADRFLVDRQADRQQYAAFNRFFTQCLKHLAGQHSQRKHGYRGSESGESDDSDAFFSERHSESEVGEIIDDMRHDRTGYLPEGYENRFDGGPGASIQYHGTGTRLTSFEGADVVYLQDNPSEAIGYATGGHRMQHARGYVLQVRRKPGKSLNINDKLEESMLNGDDPDDVIQTFIKPARERGYDYLYYEHPTFDEGNSVQRVLISLNPATSLKVIGSTVAKDFDLLQRIYEGNRFIIYKHLAGQHNQKRHGWRYTGPEGRGPSYTEPDERTVFEERLSLHPRYSPDQVAAAHATMSLCASQYNERMQPVWEAQSQLSDTMRRYQSANQEARAAWTKKNDAVKDLEKKRDELQDAYNQADEKARDARNAGLGYDKVTRAERKAQAAYDRLVKINARINSDANMRLAEQYYDANQRAENLKQTAYYALLDFERYHDSRIESNTFMYMNDTHAARATLMHHYGIEAERLRKTAIARSNYLIAMSKRDFAKGKAVWDKATELEQRMASEGKSWDEIISDPRHINLRETGRKFYDRGHEKSEKANQTFAKSLEQASPTDLSSITYHDNFTPAGRTLTGDGMDTFSRLAGKNPFLSSAKIGLIDNQESGGRAYYSYGTVTVVDHGRKVKEYAAAMRRPKPGQFIYNPDDSSYRDSNKGAVIHELGHALESFDPAIRIQAYAFYKRRTAGLSPEPLYGEMKIGSHDFTEYAIKDKWVEAYMGKTYPKRGHTVNDESVRNQLDSWGELVSVGLEQFYSNPVKMARDDPEFFRFLYAAMRLNK